MDSGGGCNIWGNPRVSKWDPSPFSSACCWGDRTGEQGFKSSLQESLPCRKLRSISTIFASFSSEWVLDVQTPKTMGDIYHPNYHKRLPQTMPMSSHPCHTLLSLTWTHLPSSLSIMIYSSSLSFSSASVLLSPGNPSRFFPKTESHIPAWF